MTSALVAAAAGLTVAGLLVGLFDEPTGLRMVGVALVVAVVAGLVSLRPTRRNVHGIVVRRWR